MAEAKEGAEAKLQAALESVRSEAEAQRKEALLQQAKYMEETHKAKVTPGQTGVAGAADCLITAFTLFNFE